MKTSNALEKVTYELPHARAREFVPRQFGDIKVVKVYASSPMFWAVGRAYEGRYWVQMGTILGVGDRRHEVTTKAAAEFVRHTKQVGELLRLAESLGWDDLTLELKIQIQHACGEAESEGT